MKREELFEISRMNIEWFKENYENLKRGYDKNWIMICDKKVVASASTFDEIIDIAKKYDPNRIIVEHIQKKPVAMFF